MSHDSVGVRTWSARYLIAGMALLLGVACAPAVGAPPARAPERPAASAAGVAETAGGAAPAAPGTAPLQALVEAVRKEGALTLVWGDSTVGSSEGMQRLAEGFNRTYGLNLAVTFTPGPAMSSMASRLLQEHQAGRPATTDVFIGYGEHMASLVGPSVLEAVDWPAWAPNVPTLDPVVDGGGVAIPIQTSLNGVTYNSSRVRPDEVPHTLQDLLDPRFKGRLAGQNAVVGFDILSMPDMWGEQRIRDYVARFADQVAGVIRCSERQRIISGEFDLFALDCSHGSTLTLKAQGAPIDFIMASDAPLMKSLYMAVPKHAAHPSAAKLWINYVRGREAQDVIYALTAMDYHRLPGSRTTADIERFQTGLSRFYEGDLDFYLRSDEAHLDNVRNEFIRMLKRS